MRLHLFEFEDYDWFPDFLRKGQTDYLHFVIKAAGIYKPAVPLVKELLDKSECNEILDLCSGGGGGIDVFQKDLEELTGRSVRVTISDKYPNIDAFELIRESTNGKINYSKEKVDVTNVPPGYSGIRTIFSAFHHFEPETARKILKNAADRKVPIAIFEGANKDILNFLGILLLTPVIFFFITPFMRPIKIKQTGVYICYSPDTSCYYLGMLEMAESVTGNSYIWKAGKAKGKNRNTVMYLVGYPAN